MANMLYKESTDQGHNKRLSIRVGVEDLIPSASAASMALMSHRGGEMEGRGAVLRGIPLDSTRPLFLGCCSGFSAVKGSESERARTPVSVKKCRVPFTLEVGPGNDVTPELTAVQLQQVGKPRLLLCLGLLESG